MKYEVLKFSTCEGIRGLGELQEEMNKFFDEYSESIEVVDVSYHTARYTTRTSGSERYADGYINDEAISALVTIKKLFDIDLSDYHQGL